MANLTVADSRDKLVAQIVSAETLIRPLLPSHVKFETLVAQMKKYTRENPRLLECSSGSLFWAFVHAAEIGLSVGDFFGEGYIMGFKQGRDQGAPPRARFVPGYKGLLKLAYQSNLVASVDAYVIYTKDVFEADLGREKDPITYKPYLGGEHPGDVIGVYTRIKLTTGAIKHDLMPLWKLELVRKGSPGARDAGHPWNTNTDEMYRKTGIRHALKDAPKSNELDRAIRLDEASDSEESFPTDNMTFPGEEPRQQLPQDGRAAQSRDRVKQRAETAQLPPKQQPILDTQGTAVAAPATRPAPAPQAQAPAPSQAAAAPAPAAAPPAPAISPAPQQPMDMTDADEPEDMFT